MYCEPSDDDEAAADPGAPPPGFLARMRRRFSEMLRASEAADPALLWRTIGSFACLVTEQLGAVVLFTGDARGLYAVGVGMMASFVFMVSGAWLLIVGVRREEAAEAIA